MAKFGNWFWIPNTTMDMQITVGIQQDKTPEYSTW